VGPVYHAFTSRVDGPPTRPTAQDTYVVDFVAQPHGHDILTRFAQVQWSTPIFKTLEELTTSSMFEVGYDPVLISCEDSQVKLVVSGPKRC